MDCRGAGGPTDGEQVWTDGQSVGKDQGYAAGQSGGCRRHREGQSPVCGRSFVSLPGWDSVAGFASALWRFPGCAYAVQSLGQARGLGESLQSLGGRCRQRIRDDGQHPCARPSAQRGRSKKAGEDQAIGRSKGGLSTKIHAVTDALGNPMAFMPTGGQACDLDGSDILLRGIEADTVLADRGYDADERVILPLQAAGKTVVLPSKKNRLVKRDYDRDLYKARHLIENFFAKLKPFRAIATRYDKTARNFLAAIHFAAAFIWLN